MNGKRGVLHFKPASRGARPRLLIGTALEAARGALSSCPVARKTLIAAALAMFILVGTAAASRVVSEGIIVVANGSLTPNTLPKTHNAPIALSASVNISTVSGASPPALQTVTLEFDRHDSLQTTGLRPCASDQLQSTTVAQARRVCADAIVGKGEAHALVKLPEGQQTPVSLPITLFDGPSVHGDPSILAHAYLSDPVPTTYVVPIVIEPIRNGIYGYRTEVTIPSIAGANGILLSGHVTIGRKWNYRSHHYSYVNARCEVGFLQTHGRLTFSNGYLLSGTLFEPCTARG